MRTDVLHVLDQRGTMRSHGCEKLRMQERNVQSSVSTHRDPCNAARSAPRLSAIPLLDAGHEFLQKKILVAPLSIARIDEETCAAPRRHYQKLSQLMLLPHVLDEIHSARMHKHLLVVPQAVQQIEDGVAARLLRVIARRQQHAVGNSMVENFAWQGNAF